MILKGSALVVLCSVGVLASSTAVSAQDLQLQASAAVVAAEQASSAGVTQMPQRPRAARLVYTSSPRRAWVIPMHVVTATMQGLDVHSTFTAFDAGAIEANPVVAGFAHHRPAFTAVKIAAAAGLIYATDKMSRRHPVRAFITAAAVNSAYAFVAANNYRVARKLR